MTQEEISKKLTEIYNEIESSLDEGFIYYSMPLKPDSGTRGGLMFTLENGKKRYLFDFPMFDSYDITNQFPPYSLVKYTFQKGHPIHYELCNSKMILEDIRLELLNNLGQILKIESTVKFLTKKELTMNILEKIVRVDNVIDRDRSFVSNHLLCFYHSLEKKIDKMFISIDESQFIVQTSPIIHGLTEEFIEKQEDLTLDESKLEDIYAFLESQNEQKIAKAIEVLKSNPNFYEKAQKRYLNLIQARLNNPNATLEQFADASPTISEVNKITGKDLAKDYISFSYCRDNESKWIVDFIGSIVKNRVSIEEFIEKAKLLENEDELISIYETFAKIAKIEIKKEAKIYTEGWYSKISNHLISLKIGRILFEKTSFDEANRSLVLKEFMFFLNISNRNSLYFDIFQSDYPNLTEIFWLLPEIPKTAWGDMELKLPKSPLKFKRSASYRIGDEGSWEVF